MDIWAAAEGDILISEKQFLRFQIELRKEREEKRQRQQCCSLLCCHDGFRAASTVVAIEVVDELANVADPLRSQSRLLVSGNFLTVISF